MRVALDLEHDRLEPRSLLTPVGPPKWHICAFAAMSESRPDRGEVLRVLQDRVGELADAVPSPSRASGPEPAAQGLLAGVAAEGVVAEDAVAGGADVARAVEPGTGS